jgi:DNA modification methylase
MYIDHLLEVMREVHRVLKDTGVAWFELGDCYVTHPSGPVGEARCKASTITGADRSGAEQAGPPDKRGPGIQEKNLALVPFRFAIAVQEAGWIVRGDIPWIRSNPMPESCKDRPTRSHTFIFMLTKKPRYFYDPDGYREPLSEATHARISQRTFWDQTGGAKDYRFGINPNRSVRQVMENMAIRMGAGPKTAEPGSGIHANSSFVSATALPLAEAMGRNLRDSWTINTQALSEPHYAAFPEEIPRRTILLSTSARGNCPECGSPWKRLTRFAAGAAVPTGWTPTCGCQQDPCQRCGVPWEREMVGKVVSTMNVRVRDAKKGVLGQKSGLGGEIADASEKEVGDYDGNEAHKITETSVTWPGCPCFVPVPAVVLDPFLGSGTTLKVARELGRRSVGIELNPFYCHIAEPTRAGIAYGGDVSKWRAQPPALAVGRMSL